MGTSLFPAGADDVVYVVDLSSYLLRAYHAVAPLSSPEGEPTHAVHGTVTMLERLFRERKPKLLAIAMDSGRNTFRKEMYPEYKANRPPAPDDLRVQIHRAEEVVRAQGLTVYKQQGVEADDLIATAVVQARQQGLKVVIVSADKDLMQLIDEGVVMWDTLRNKVFGPPEVEERFKVKPEQIGDLLALMGDSSDNIPGVPSVGPKTAATLLADHGDLEGIYAALDTIKRKKLKETLTTNEDAARMSRKLVALKEDCDIEVTAESLRFGDEKRIDISTLSELYEVLGFTRQLAALRDGKAEIQLVSGAAPPTEQAGAKAHSGDGEAPAKESTSTRSTRSALTPAAVEVITEESALGALIPSLLEGTWALELHTTEPAAHRGPLIGLCLTKAESESSQAYYLPFAHRYIGAPQQLPATASLAKILDALRSSTTRSEQPVRLVVHDLKRSQVLATGADVEGLLPPAFDTMLASYLMDPERNHGVEALGDRFGVTVVNFDEIRKEKRKKRPLDELEVQVAAEFVASRGAALLSAAAEQQELLGETHLGGLLEEIEQPLARLLAIMEVRGVLIDSAVLGKLGDECEIELSALEKKAYEAAGKEFNVASPRQLEGILFDEIGLKPLKRTKTARSTDAQTLEALADEHELPKVILAHRQIAKLKGTYIDALPNLMNPETGRVHGSWEQAVAATGRLSSTDPNLQNIPIRSELGRKIRGAFVPPEGYQLISADYSQIELRVLAHLSSDERLVDAFNSGQDIHTRTAMEIFEIPEQDVTREQRSRAKAVNFGVIYGQGESALAKSLGIERAVAGSFIAAYFQRYEGVKHFMDSTLEKARLGEAVQSILGRRRVVPDIKSGNRGRRLAAERIAMNMPIQGSAADILKLAMLALAEPPTPGARMTLTVHDELVFEVPDAEVEDALLRIRTAMEGAYELTVPLVVSVGQGPNWNEAH